MRTIPTSHCILEPQFACHAKEMFLVLSDPAIYEFENAPPINEGWLEGRFRRLEQRCSTDGSERWLNWVLRIATGELVGYVQATVERNGTAILAYELNSRFWRLGIGRSAVQGMMSELQSSYGAEQFVAVLKAKNYRSSGLLRNLGFVQASQELAERYCDEPDEIVLVKSLEGSAYGA